MSNTLWNRARGRRTLGLISATTLAALTWGVAPQATAQDPGGVRYDRASKKTKAKSNLVDTKFKTAKEAEEKRLIAEYKEKFYNPYQAAARGYVDDVIEPSQTRPRLIQALELITGKRDNNPSRKHGNIPL